MAQDIVVEEGESDTLLFTVAPLGALFVPCRAANWDDNTLGVIFVLIIAQTVSAVGVALAIDVALVPRFVDTS